MTRIREQDARAARRTDKRDLDDVPRLRSVERGTSLDAQLRQEDTRTIGSHDFARRGSLLCCTATRGGRVHRHDLLVECNHMGQRGLPVVIHVRRFE